MKNLRQITRPAKTRRMIKIERGGDPEKSDFSPELIGLLKNGSEKPEPATPVEVDVKRPVPYSHD